MIKIYSYHTEPLPKDNTKVVAIPDHKSLLHKEQYQRTVINGEAFENCEGMKWCIR